MNLIEKYSTDWPSQFLEIKNELKVKIGSVSYEIEHVGSTSVPNLDSKPIIDIDIIYTQQAEFDTIKFELEKVGYYHNGNQGVPDRDVFKRNGLIINKTLDKIIHHLYVCPINSKELERHLLFRNYLRNNDWARIAYQTLKYELAEKSNQDKKVYAFLKENHLTYFFETIIEKQKMLLENYRPSYFAISNKST